MQITFKEENSKAVNMIKSVDLKEIFSIIEYGAKDKETKQAIDRALTILNEYSINHKNHEGKFVKKIKPILRSKEVKEPIGKRTIKSFKND